MERLKQIGQLCRQHYEKLLLTVVLLVLGFAVWFLFVQSANEEQKLQEIPVGFERRAVKPVKPVDLAGLEGSLKLMKSAPPLNLSGPHNLFNPVKWQRKPDGSLLKIQTGDEIGLGAMMITNITPLYMIISFDKVQSTNLYQMGVIREGAKSPDGRKKRQKLARLNEKSDAPFVLREVKGPPEDPTELVLELVEGGEKVSVSKEKPYRRPDGFEADLNYTVAGKAFRNLRPGSPLSFGGEDYIVVAISQDEVVLSARSNDKKYTLRRVAAR